MQSMQEQMQLIVPRSQTHVKTPSMCVQHTTRLEVRFHMDAEHLCLRHVKCSYVQIESATVQFWLA